MRTEWVGIFALSLAVACSGRPGGVARSAAGRAAPCAASGRSALRPVPGARGGSTVALGRLGNRALAFAIDEDDGVVHTVDLDRRIELATTRLGGVPSHAIVTADGRLIVLLRDRATLAVFEPAASLESPLEARCAIPTAEEPVDLALSPDDSTLLVTSGWAHVLSAFDARAVTPAFEVNLPRDPRAVVVSADGARAFVSHVVGSTMSVVDLAEHRARPLDLDQRVVAGASELERVVPGAFRPRSGCQGFALAKVDKPEPRVLAPQVLVDSGDVTLPALAYGDISQPTEQASIAVVSVPRAAVIDASLFAGVRFRSARRDLRAECLLPRAAAVDESRGELLVACLGLDAIVAFDARDYDPRGTELRRWSVAAGPTGIAIDAAAGRAVVWSQFDRTLGILDLGGPSFEERMTAAASPVVRIPLSRRAQPPAAADLARGRRLFHATTDPRISSDGRACASCHPDGRDDALTWSTPDGPRQTPMLAGRLRDTAPYAWSGTGRGLHEHLQQTFRRLGGAGLDDGDLDALVGYAMSMSPAGRPGPAGEALARRGRAIFESPEAKCASCHGDGLTPDGKRHDVHSRTHADNTAGFDTPSLHLVGGTAPYFHDGRYLSLRELLIDSDGTMGDTRQLTPADLDALEAFLRAL